MELSEQIGKTCQHFQQRKITKEVIANLNHAKIQLCQQAVCVNMIGSHVGNLKQTLSVLHRQKGASSKSGVHCPTITKKYNQSIVGFDIFDQQTAAHNLDRRSKFRFHLHIFFDPMDDAMVNDFII